MRHGQHQECGVAVGLALRPLRGVGGIFHGKWMDAKVVGNLLEKCRVSKAIHIHPQHGPLRTQRNDVGDTSGDKFLEACRAVGNHSDDWRNIVGGNHHGSRRGVDVSRTGQAPKLLSSTSSRDGGLPKCVSDHTAERVGVVMLSHRFEPFVMLAPQ